jgi:hypothetical protein
MEMKRSCYAVPTSRRFLNVLYRQSGPGVATERCRRLLE